MTPSLVDLAPEYVRGFQAYTPSRPDPVLARQYGVTHLHRLNNNENALGPTPASRAVIADFAPPRAAIYPSGDSYLLRQALGRAFGKDSDRFLVGNGSCEVIASVIKAFCGPGDNIVTADKTFAVYEWVADFSGFQARLAPLRDWGFDPEGMLAAADGRTKIFFVCNPNNPTGTWWDEGRMERFLAAVGGRALVVVDEAYREFVDTPGFPDGMDLLERHPNVVVFRTFSKMYGLAALRVGYLCGAPEVVDLIRRTHVVYSVNTLGQEAARAAVEDDGGHMKATREMVAAAREIVRRACVDLGLEHIGGEGNFLMLRTKLPDTLLYRKLMRRGVMVRTMTGFRFPNWIRVTLGLAPVMEEFTTALAEVLRGA